MTSMNKKDYSTLHETTVANFLGWSRVSGSGARPNHPGDIVSEEWLGECKTHIRRGEKIKFEYKVWRKLLDEASSQFKRPAYFSDDGSQSVGTTWVMFLSQDLPKDFLVVQLPEVNQSYSFDGFSRLKDMRSRIDDTEYSHLVYVIKMRDTYLFLTDLTTFKEII